MYLYVYKGFHGGPDRQQKSDELIRMATKLYLTEKGEDPGKFSMEISRTEKGKPGFSNLPLEFSVSHSGDLWVCLIADKKHPVGVDIQVVKDNYRPQVMQRYYTAEESRYVMKSGNETFFQIWTRKEAYAKYTGKGITRELAGVSTIDNDQVFFIDFDIADGVKGACCVKEKGELCLRMM